MDGQTTHRLEHHQTRHATNHTEPGNQVPRAAREINDRLNPNSWKLCPLPLSNLQSNCANRLPHWFPPVPKQAEWISGCPIDRSYLLSAPSRWQYWQERRAEWLARLLRTDWTGLRVLVPIDRFLPDSLVDMFSLSGFGDGPRFHCTIHS